MRKYLSNYIKIFLIILNKVLPKYPVALIRAVPNIEAGSIEIANCLRRNYNIRVIYIIDKHQPGSPKGLLLSDIIIKDKHDISYFLRFLTSRYIFFTHGFFVNSFSKRQVVINLWHGVFYKPIGKLLGKGGMYANTLPATSELTKKMFIQAFGMEAESVIIAGAPRNDILISSKGRKHILLKQVGEGLDFFDKIIIWLPTFRKSCWGDVREDGKEVGNPFYIKDFDINSFDDMLKRYNALCIVKPHPMAPRYHLELKFHNLLFIDEEWLCLNKCTLYHIVGCTDILISDISSIIIDYLLMDHPIVCVSTDFEEYRGNRGFYFRNMEEWIPSSINKTSSEFFKYLELLLSTGHDPFEVRRKKLKDCFFRYQDARSTERLVNHIFEKYPVKCKEIKTR